MVCMVAAAQETFPVNGVTDIRNDCFAFTNATIVKDPQTTLQNATLVIRKGKIVAVGTNIAPPKDAVVVDCKGKYIILPSLICLAIMEFLYQKAAAAAMITIIKTSATQKVLTVGTRH